MSIYIRQNISLVTESLLYEVYSSTWSDRLELALCAYNKNNIYVITFQLNFH